MKQVKLILAFLVCFLFFTELYAGGLPPIALSTSWPIPAGGTPFYGIHVGGTAFTQILFADFDTEGRTLIVPEGCVNKAKVTVLVPDTLDEWFNHAEILMGDVTLTSADGATHYTATMPFFAETGKPCDPPNSFINFGVAMSVFPNPEQRTNGYSHICTATPTHSCNYLPPVSTYSPACVGGFFSYYNYPAGTQPGFTVSAYKTNSPMLTIGSIAPGNYAYQLPNRPTFNCLGNRTLPDCTGVQFWGTTVPNINVQIGSVLLPLRQSMLDTGGGLLLARDDVQGTYTKALQAVLSPCPRGLTFLTGCQCVSAGQSVLVSTPDNSLNYSYSTSDIRQTQRFSVAICPNSAFASGGQAPYVMPNGVNLGFAFFNLHHSVSYNRDTCTIYAN